MHFKYIKMLSTPVLLLSVLTLLASCSYFFEEKKKESEVTYSEKSGTCMNQVNRTLKSYFDSKNTVKISHEEIDQIEACYENTIEALVKYTKSGRSSTDEYKAENFDLLFKKMYQDANVSLAQLQSYIQFKQFLVGGKKDSVTKKELKIISNVLPTFTKLLKEMEPYRAVLYRSAQLTRDDQGYEDFNSIYKLFKFNLGLLLKEFEPYQSDRKINIRELGQFILSEFYGEEAQDRLKYLDLIVSFKNLVLNKTGDDLMSQDLSAFTIQTVLTYQALSQFEFFIREENIFTSLGTLACFVVKIPGQLQASHIFKTKTLDSLLDVINIIERVIVRSTRGHETGKISFDKVSDLIFNLEKSELIKDSNLSAQTLNQFLKEFSSQWFDPGARRDPDITAAKMTYVKSLVVEWSDRQKLINDLFIGNPKSVNLLNLPEAFNKNNSINEWKRVLHKVSVHQWDQDKRLLFNKDLRDMSYEELTVSNSIRTVVELFMRPYNATKANALTHKVTEDQAQEVYTVLRILGIEMGFMDSRIFDSGRRSFGEGNNFSSQRANDKYMDFYEGYEYLAVAMSSGRLAQDIYESIDSKYFLDYSDVYHELVTDADSFRENFENRFLSFFSHLKTIKKYWSSANSQKKEKFLNALELATRSGVISEKPYDIGEIRTVSTILYYLESIFNVFDSNQDGMASGQELVAAEKHFRSLMVKFILDSQIETLKTKKELFAGYMKKSNPSNQEMAEWLAPKVFVYLLEYGEIPKGFSFAFWGLLSPDGEAKRFNKLEADAQAVLRVFSVLAKINHETHLLSIKDFLVKQHGFFKEGTLISELSESEAPDCLKNPKASFCQWARVISCNENMNEYLYDWMSNNRYELFPESIWQLNTKTDVHTVDKLRKELPFQTSLDLGIRSSAELTQEVEEAAERTMKIFEKTFRKHKKFSTLCGFPQINE